MSHSLTDAELQALVAAGADPSAFAPTFSNGRVNKPWTMHGIAEAARNLPDVPLSLNQFCQFTGVPKSRVYSEFGTWTICAESLGITLRKGGRERLTRTRLMADVLRVWRKLGTFPTGADYSRHGRYSRNVVFERVGKWSEMKRELKQLYPSGPYPPEDERE